MTYPLLETSPKTTKTVEQARKVVTDFRGGFTDSLGRVCGDHLVNRVIDAAERHGDDVTVEIVDWKLRVGIA